ncbi:MAG: hypothetical protein ACHQFX_14550 [Chitinophagales bacterium]
MKSFYYLIIADIILVLISIKIIFKTTAIFIKAILGHAFSDSEQDIEALKRWEIENDIQHKVNLFYAAIIAIAVSSFIFYYFLM